MMLVFREMLRMAKANEAAVCDNAERSFDDFSIICTVGKGTYGHIYKAVDPSARQYLTYVYLLYT